MKRLTILEDTRHNKPGFLVESVLRDNIEDSEQAKHPEPWLKISDIGRIVDLLEQAQTPNLVISVHGFNTNRDEALKRFSNAFVIVDQDSAITRDVISVGFRWPSEGMFSLPWSSSFTAAPWFLIGLFLAGILSSIFYAFFGTILNVVPAFAEWPFLRPILLAIGVTLLAIVMVFMLLRCVVYFRDGYRATHFGAPDLVDFIRQIDEELVRRNKHSTNGVRLSFIGHSMGGYVVTNAVRIMSDVFSQASVKRNYHDPQIKNIGNSFRLQNLVLVSPDIPAEALMPNVANFLKSSLGRFSEAYLFSNTGDEVLRQISVSANYFTFPSKSRDYGYRLGNLGADHIAYGFTISGNWNLENLNIGYQNVSKLSIALGYGANAEHPAYGISYFDCTDCINDKGEGILTTARRNKPFLPDHWYYSRISWCFHLYLLIRYFLKKPDVHSGYFDFDELAKLIYRLASIGYEDTNKALVNIGGISSFCSKYQIKGLERKLSPENIQ